MCNCYNIKSYVWRLRPSKNPKSFFHIQQLYVSGSFSTSSGIVEPPACSSGHFFLEALIGIDVVAQKVHLFFRLGWTGGGGFLRIHALSPVSGRSPYGARAQCDRGSPQMPAGCPASCSRQRRRGLGDV